MKTWLSQSHQVTDFEREKASQDKEDATERSWCTKKESWEDIALDRKTSGDEDEGEEISDLEEMGLID